MAVIDFLYVCDHAFLDSNNRPCILGIIESVAAPSFPHFRALLTCATIIRTEPNEQVDLHFEYGMRGDAPLISLRIVPQLPLDGGRTMLPIQFGQVQFPKQGVYSIAVRNFDKTIATSLFLVEPRAS
jgi:hypothetical protein